MEMLSRRVTLDIGSQCAHQTHDGSAQIRVENACYDVVVQTIPHDFDALPSSSLAEMIPPSSDKPTTESLLAGICRRFGVSYVRVDAAASTIDLLTYGAEIEDGPGPFPSVICLVEVGGGYEKLTRFRVVYLAYSGESRTLHELALFAHHNFSVHSPRFNLLITQLVETFRQFAVRSVFPVFSPYRIRVDSNLLLRLTFEDVFHLNAFEPVNQPDSNENSGVRLWDYTQQWCQWKLSNLEYLLKLNEFAGRYRADMTRPAVVPWVTDFLTADGAASLRPLDLTKYRLNKGDAQLHEQFRGSVPAYHVPELLSDIGWLVYRARVTPRDVLCRYVRSTWVPEEYPSSMARLYSWTPDECIPDFYDDPTVFRSRHDDLADLSLPAWALTPTEFICWHRDVLESEAVSERLHKWIDLAFGYLLTGQEAVDALNVHLSYADAPAGRQRTNGAVQLFTRSHPRRLSRSDSKISACDASVTLLPTTTKKSVRSAALPDESVALMSALRDVYTAHSSRYCERSLASVGITVVELALAEYCRDLAAGATLADRLGRAQILLHDKSHRLPRNLRLALNLLLSADCFSKIRPDTLSTSQTGDVSASLRTFFATPPNVIDALALLSRYQHVKQQLRVATAERNEYNTQQLTRECVALLTQCLTLDEHRDLWLDVFIDALDGDDTAGVYHRLLGRASELAAGDTERDRARLVACIRRLLDSPKRNAKLLDRRFVLQLCVRFGSETFFISFLPNILEALLFTTEPDNREAEAVRETAKETILWLARRYGPFVTATQISSRLLALLSVCYSNEANRKPNIEQMSLEVRVLGDVHCKRIADCLVDISAIYGTAFISLQYIPYFADIMALAARRLALSNGANVMLESSAIAAIVALSTLCDAFSDRQLMDHLQDAIVDGVLFPAVRLFSTANSAFSSSRVRRLFAVKTIGTLHLLALRVGAENVRRHLAGAVQRVFCAFNVVYDDASGVRVSENAPKQLAETFTPDFARLLVAVFSAICSRQFIIDGLPNAPLIFSIAALPNDDDSTSNTIAIINKPIVPRASPRPIAVERSTPRGTSLELSSSTSILNGHRLASFALGASDADSTPPPASPVLIAQTPSFGSAPASLRDAAASAPFLSATQFDPDANFPALNLKMNGADGNATRLTGRWVDQLRAVLSRISEVPIFNHISLATFRGHTDAIRRVRALDNENSFVSASADRTVRLWSVRVGGAIDVDIAPRWTYMQHMRSVQDIVLLPANGLIATADSASVHVWDPFRGVNLHHLDVSGVSGLAHLRNNIFGIATTENSVVRTFDGRSGEWCNEMHAWPTTTAVHVRAIAASPDGANKLAVALSNCSTAILDIRSGKILATFASLNSKVIQLEWLTSETLAAIHADHPVEIWTLTSTSATAAGSVTQLTGVTLTRRLSEIASTLVACRQSNTAVRRRYASNIPMTTIDPLGSATGVSLQRRAGGKIPKPGGVPATDLLNDFNPSTPFVTMSTGGSANRLYLHSDARAGGSGTEVKLRSDLAPGEATALEYLPMNNLFLLGCSNGVIRLAS